MWIVDTRTGRDLSFNYGLFHMKEPHFMLNFVRGRMKYSMNDGGPYRTSLDSMIYSALNRTIWVQELNLTAAQKSSLRDFLKWNNQPDHMFYMYDHFRDNCTTRLRDALDRVLGGQVQRTLAKRASGVTYRWHARRLLSASPPAYAGFELAMGHSVDVPLSQWDNSFLPTELMKNLATVQVIGADGKTAPLVMSSRIVYKSTRAPMRMSPPDYRIAYSIIGLLFGGVFCLLAALARRGSRTAVRVLGAVGAMWALSVGFFGLVSMLMWFATDHTATRANENLLQANVLSLVLAAVLIAVAMGRARRSAMMIACIVAGLSLIGFMIQVLPGFDQFNGEIIGLLMPAHIGMALGLTILCRPLPVRQHAAHCLES